MALSLTESAARVSIIRFLKGFIFAGNLTLQEEDGNVLSFEGSLNMCPYSVSLRIHNPQFYWKLAIEADLGLANAFIQGDFSCVDKDEGLLNLLMILIANKYSLSSAARINKNCVEHVENIGDHYYTTIRCWRKNFLENQSKILSLGFDEKFIRTWEYYFDYSAAGFKMRTLGDYQVVFSRQGNTVTFNDPYARIPSAHCCP